MFLKIWLAKCYLKIVWDGEQAISYLVKYVLKPEAISENVNDLLRLLFPSNNETEEESKGQTHQELSLPVSGLTSIRNIDICSLGEQDKSKQEIMHFLLQENYVSYFSIPALIWIRMIVGYYGCVIKMWIKMLFTKFIW